VNGLALGSEAETLRLQVARLRGQVQTLGADLAAARVELSRWQDFTTALLETIDVGVISCDPNGGRWTRNRASREMLGLVDPFGGSLPPVEAAGRTDVRSADGTSVPVEDYPLMRALRGEDVGAVEMLLGPAGATPREVLSRNHQIRDGAGEVLGAVCTLTDMTSERTAVRALAEEHRRLREAQRIGQLGSFQVDLTTGETGLSDELLALWGLSAGTAGNAGTAGTTEAAGTAEAAANPGGTVARLRSLVHPDDRAVVRASWQEASQAGGRHGFEYRVRRADDGAERRLRCIVEMDLDADGRPVRARGTNQDITELSAAEQAAKDAGAFLDAVLTASPDYTFVTELATGAVVYGSGGACVLGLTSAELQALGSEVLATLVHPDDQDRLRAANVTAAGLADGDVLQLRYRGRDTEGRWRWIHRRVTPFKRDAFGAVVQVAGVMRDVTEAVALEEQQLHASLHDPLTGLANRSMLMLCLERALERSAADGREVTVLFCDLDGFKAVNDAAGHAAGDMVLREIAERIARIVREGDTVARVGGDEFVVVLDRPATPDGGDSRRAAERDRATANQIASRIGDAVRHPVRYDGLEHRVSASIGMTFARGSAGDDATPGARARDAAALLQHADAMMYRAKARGKDCVVTLTTS
jgi:diguanylate cyclase (GGDEF)-like protein/PAS domain S-box-containing protein